MKAFAYLDARTEQEALAALDPERGKVIPLAGGMDALGLMKDYVFQPDRVVNVKRLDASLTEADGLVRIGAAVTLTDLQEHPLVVRYFPGLVQMAREIGTPQIRHRGTVGGNIAQRPRCWYFRNEEFHCLKKGGARCYAVEGENQLHAIFGSDPCHIVHPSSLAVPVQAYGGRFRVVGPSGAREVEAADFFVMPSRNIWSEIALEPDELLTHVLLPIPDPSARSASYEVRHRQSHDWPLAFASVVVRLDGATVAAASIVMGAVAPIPWRAVAAERSLTGQPFTREQVERAADAAIQGAQPMSGNAYKVSIARAAVKRALLRAAGLDELA